jgi:hypothetical protein
MNLAMLVQLDQSPLWANATTAGITKASLTGPGAAPIPAADSRGLDDMSAAIVALAPVAATGLAPMRDALASVGSSCRSCHAAYPEVN